MHIIIRKQRNTHYTTSQMSQPINVSWNRHASGNGRAAPPCTPGDPNPRHCPPWRQPTAVTWTRSGCCCCCCRRGLRAAGRPGRRGPAERPGSRWGGRRWGEADVWGGRGGAGAGRSPRAPSPPGTSGSCRPLGLCN